MGLAQEHSRRFRRPPMHETPASGSVTRYYESNTRRFLLVGGGGSIHGIHRQLWAPGVRTTSEATDYINLLVTEHLQDVSLGDNPTILDMGCGVGGTLFRLAEFYPNAKLHGITISPKQSDIAKRLKTRKGLGQRCQIHLGDFESARLGVKANAIVTIEAYTHTKNPRTFFSAAAEHLGPDSHLLLVDDFVEPQELNARQRSIVTDLKVGWHLSALSSVESCVRAAEEVGLALSSNTDLTPLIRLGRPRDRAINLLGPVFRTLGLAHVPFFANMIGGRALQVGLREKFLAYRFLTFQKNVSA